MDQLPDDVLVRVMSLLSEVAVLACRLVCKRFGGLALHPDVWRHRRASFGHGNICQCAVLRLAPCLRELVVDNWHKQRPSDGPRLTLFVATCAVRELSLYVGAKEVQPAARLIRQQQVAGRLRAVSVSFRSARNKDAAAADDALSLLLMSLASTSGVKISLSVDVEGNLPKSSRLVEDGTVVPTLRKLSCHLRQATEHFLESVLARHATTLEDVDLVPIPDSFYTPAPAASPARLLAGMPNLRKLHCCLIPGLDGVAACESLRELRLTVMSSHKGIAANTAGAAELLRRATQLRDVHVFDNQTHVLHDVEHHASRNNSIVELIGGLTSCEGSQLESLYVEHEGGALARLQSLLEQALPSLPTLRRFKVNVASQQLLSVITPDTNPSLRSLQLYRHEIFELTRWICPHAMLHTNRLKDILSANPSLHVELHSYVCSAGHPCGVCRRLPCRLSLENKLHKYKYVGVFAHPVGKCASPEDHASVGLWFHVSDLKHYNSCQSSCV
ncbi:uncharacterized protein LOC113205859 [Frankliniella occidentalis]|uniref:Uncharacterized protein LOC113205859 n=1 Tax=Frankliniella occidentalis TaxID=133901 RepID=A0A6J1SFN6_FRAOC|nr:uncharacterized protein LOC113205859 [Frankliniella occidentalis]